jgi:hypothetical protein
MKVVKIIPVLLVTLLAAPVFAQSVASEVQRDVNQQKRIESGLQSGQLTSKEAAKLEREQAHINHAEKNALKDGVLSNEEKVRIQNMQNKASDNIYAEKHDAQTGNPNSASSKRMQADVQRNVNQQERIAAGVKSGALTNHEVAKLEGGQAKVAHKEAQAGKDGHISAKEQRKIKHAEKHQSKRIHHEKTDGQIAR